MKQYVFETDLGIATAYDLRVIKREALEAAKELNTDVFVTCVTKPSEREDWYTMRPNGEWITELKNVTARKLTDRYNLIKCPF